MSKPVLYYDYRSPPSRACLITIKALELDVELRLLDLLKGDCMKPEFLKMNPTHTVPVLEDNGSYIFDSHAIMSYLNDKYAKNDKLYPKDLVVRAKVHQALYFDTGVLFCRLRFLIEPVLYHGGTVEPQDKIDYINTGLGLLEDFIGDKKYVAGENLSIADFACITSVTSIEMSFPVDKKRFPKIAEWWKRMQQLPYLDPINKNGMEGIRNTYQQLLVDNRKKAGIC